MAARLAQAMAAATEEAEARVAAWVEAEEAEDEEVWGAKEAA